MTQPHTRPVFRSFDSDTEPPTSPPPHLPQYIYGQTPLPQLPVNDPPAPLPPSHNPFIDDPAARRALHFSDNPFEPSAFVHLKASVIFNCATEVAFFTLVAILVCVLLNSNGVRVLQLPPAIITLLSVVLGFSISYRTSSAYERWTEGRKLWAHILYAERQFAMGVWHSMDFYPDGGATEDQLRREIIEKKTMIGLAGAFAVSCKHYLRGEPGIGYTDLYPLVSFLPRYRLKSGRKINPEQEPFNCENDLSKDDEDIFDLVAEPITDPPSPTTPSDSVPAGAALPSTLPSTRPNEAAPKPATPRRRHLDTLKHPLLPGFNPPPWLWSDHIPGAKLIADLFFLVTRIKRPDFLKKHRMTPKSHRRVAKRKRSTALVGSLPLPVELIMILKSWLTQRSEEINWKTGRPIIHMLEAFAESLAGLERILFTPLPVSYQVHLQQCVYIYLLLLPSQIVALFGWITIPVVFIVSFVLLGFLQIGHEIENPFGYEISDLDLDEYCRVILTELSEITAHDPADLKVEEYLFVDTNLPFAFYPNWESKSAKEMLEDEMPIAEMRDELKTAGGHVKLRAMARRRKGAVVLDLGSPRL